MKQATYRDRDWSLLPSIIVPAYNIRAGGHEAPRSKAGDMTAPGSLAPTVNNNHIAKQAPSRHDGAAGTLRVRR
jgi:hypothetical protein